MSSYQQKYYQHQDEKALVSSQQRISPAPFPSKYVHCVFDSLCDLVQAVHALRADGHNSGDIHVMSCWDYIAAVERKREHQSYLLKMLTCLYGFFDEGFDEVYLQEARKGNHMLMVRLSSSRQLKRVSDALILHHAHMVRYVDTWMVIYLSP
ncbi:MAG TPA: hypothetical protein VKV20_16130 [Ktedonobacteraceae bacterium]|nr:hypothetical protein [Ktedonobacteraceae bacterium]